MIEFDILGNHSDGLIVLVVLEGKSHKIIIDYIQAFNLLTKLTLLLKDLFIYTYESKSSKEIGK